MPGPPRILTEPIICLPSLSNGRLVTMLIQPPIAPSVILAVGDFITSIREIKSDGTFLKSASLLVPVPANAIPFISALFKSALSPLIATRDPSPLALSICIPVTRCKASATFESGSLPTSNATIESIILSAFFFTSLAVSKLALYPVTTTSSISSSS